MATDLDAFSKLCLETLLTLPNVKDLQPASPSVKSRWVARCPWRICGRADTLRR